MGEREITARSDVYALGASTYEMLTGDPPFTGSTAQAIVAKVMTEQPRPLQRQRERVPDAVEDAVLTALEKLPADRFATAAEFAEALARPPGTARSRISAVTARRAPRRSAVETGSATPSCWRSARSPSPRALLAAWTRRTAPERAGAGGALHPPRGAERPHQLARLQLARGLARRPRAGLPRPGRRPAPAADVRASGRRHRAAAAGHRGRRAPDLLPRRPMGRLHPRQPALQGRRRRRARRSCSGRRPARSTARAGRRPASSSFPATRRCIAIPESGGGPRACCGHVEPRPASCYRDAPAGRRRRP